MTISIAEAHEQLTVPGSPFEVEVVEIRGIPTRTWKNAMPSLRAVLERSRQHGEASFLVYEDERITFAEHYAQAAEFARRLVTDFGVEKGDRVAIAMRNFPEWPVAFWGAAAAGAVVVPLNAWWTAPELEYGLTDSGSKVLVADGERYDRLRDVLPGIPGLATLVVRGDAAGSAREAVAWSDVVPPLAGDEAPDLPDVEIAPDDYATIFYTSGTTGRPKGALGTQRNFTTNLMSLTFAGARSALRSGRPPSANAAPDAPRIQNASLLSVPFFHATGCHSVLQGATAAGNKLVLMHKWNPERALELIERERITNFGGVPSMVWQVLQSPDFEKRDTSSVQGIGYGGAPAPPELVRKIEEMFPGRSPSNGYGLTETSSLSTSNSGADYQRKPDSVGAPVAVVELKVVDELGNELPQGEVGELWIKGPNVVAGYWGKPEATAASFTDGWLHTGDVARIDDEGFVYIVDRAKDMIIRGGENVYCSEVEAALFEHPAVLDAAVIGVPHQVLGEEVGAVVQLKPGAQGTATADDLRAHVAARLAAFKVPVHVWFVDDDLPRNPAGKVLKRELREQVL
ncbi:MAG TPA: class I adenylate-forming enzyme family protein [Acidimicrobiales bacterium]|jgi:long-chain acyl-CoA synthetase|nr:class I adenylate-forming enzyme family protein [Acidimicrobiales bacterium]